MARAARFESLMSRSGRNLDVARAVVTVIGTGLRLSREVSGALDAVGLSSQQFVVLMELAASPDGKLPLTVLMERTQSSAPNTSALVSRMAKAGSVHKSRGEDQRVVIVAITEIGWGMLESGAPLVIDTERRLAAGLGKRELGDLVDLLHKFSG